MRREGKTIDDSKVIRVILISLLLFTFAVYMKGYIGERVRVKRLETNTKVVENKEIGIKMVIPDSYTPVKIGKQGLSKEERKKKLGLMWLDEEYVMDAFMLGDDEGYMIISIRQREEDKEKYKEEMGLEEVKEIKVKGNTDTMYVGLRDEGKKTKVERYIREVGLNDIVVDVEHILPGNSFKDIEYILNSIIEEKGVDIDG